VPSRVRPGCLTQLLLIAVIAVALYLATMAIFAPWSYYLGGRFHIVPGWQGVGTMHTASGDYALQLLISPEPYDRTFNLPYFRGWGTLCTPRGERYSMRVSAGMSEHPGTDTSGQRREISMSVYHGPVSRQPQARETVSLTLHEIPWTSWLDCRTSH
jgi:hypothetical protein